MNETTPSFPLPPTTPKRSFRWPLALLVVALVLVVAGAGAFAWWQLRQGSGETDIASSNAESEAQARQVTDAYNDGRFDVALADMERILAQNDSNVEALLFAAATWAQRGQIEYKEAEYGAKAIELAERALNLSPGNAEGLRILGYAHEIQNQWDEAIDYYNQAIASDPERGELYAHRGHARDLAGDLRGAKEDYVRAVELDSESMIAAENLARIYMREGDFGKARDLLMTVAEKTDNQRLKAESYFNLSSVALHLDEDAAASLDWATKAVEADPVYPPAYVGQARIYVIQDQQEEAAEALERAFELYPNLTSAYVWMGIGYNKSGQNAEAIDAFTRGRAAIAEDIHLMENEREALTGRFNFYLAVLQAEENNAEAALELLSEAIVQARGDVITLRLIENGFRAGTQGAFAPLVGLPEYEQLAAAFVSGEASAELLSTTLPYAATAAVADAGEADDGTGWIPEAQAEVINFQPHSFTADGSINVSGSALDALITNLLTQFVRREINMASLAQQCEAAILAGSGGRLHCVITTDQPTGIITISCTNVVIAQYIPRPPTAVIEAPTTVCKDETVRANALLSSDPDGTIRNYQWRLRIPPFNLPRNTFATISPSGEELSFLAQRTGTYTLELTVTDDTFLQHMTVHTVQVSTTGNCQNQAPQAVIAVPETACLATDIRADGSGSRDTDGTVAAYQWSITDPQGNAVAVPAENTAVTFKGTKTGVYQSQLTVTDDDGLSDTATAQTTVSNGPPVAIILVDQQGSANSRPVYQLDGSTSYDPDRDTCGHTIRYEWEVRDSSGRRLTASETEENSLSSPTVTFTGVSQETYEAVLRVYDPPGASDSTTTTLRDGTAVTPTPTPSPSATPKASISPSLSPSPTIQIGPGTIRETD